MCGQAGIIRMGDKPITVDMMSLFLVGNEHRGNDATGVAISQADGTVVVCKDDDPAWQFVTRKKYNEFIKDNLKPDTWAVLLHTRAATKGSPRDNKNNHPMFNGAGAIVHNGIIHNDDQLFRETGWEKSAETDSDIIRAMVDSYGITKECVKQLNRLSGSAAGAAIHPEFPKQLLLYRTGSPMTLGSNDSFLVWSSEKNTIHRALKPWVKRFGMFFQEQRPEIAFAPFPDDTAWIIGEKGLVYHGKFKALHHTYTEPFRRTYEGYKERQVRWDEDDKRTRVTSISSGQHPKQSCDDAYCDKCGMEWFIPRGANPAKYICDQDHDGCGAELVAKPAVITVGAN